MTPWGNCSGACGLAQRHRRVLCLFNEKEVDDSYCEHISNEKPLTVETCTKANFCPNWTIERWSEVCFDPCCFFLIS